MSLTSHPLILSVVSCLVFELSSSAIPEGLHGELQQGTAPTQVDPMGDTYWVQVGAAETDESGQCFQLISIAGHMISDQLSLPCTTFPIVSADKRTMIVGETLYADSEAPNSLIKVTGQACEEFIYEYTQGTLNKYLNHMLDQDCRRVKEKMKLLLTELVKKNFASNSELIKQANQKLDQICADLSPPKPAPTSTNVGATANTPKKKHYDVDISKPMNMNGKQVQNIAVTGPGIVSDAIQLDASEPTDVIKSENRLIVGRVLFSNKPGEIIHVTGDKCIQKTYAKDGTLQMKDLSDSECQAVRKEIREARGEKDSSQLLQNTPQAGTGQKVLPIGEIILSIVNSLSQIVKMIFSLITQNVMNIARSPLNALQGVASGINGLASSFWSPKPGNTHGARNGIESNGNGRNNYGSGPVRAINPQTSGDAAANPYDTILRGVSSQNRSEELNSEKMEVKAKLSGFNPLSGLLKKMNINI